MKKKRKKPTYYQYGGDVKPIYVTDPNDPRYRVYWDSLAAFRSTDYFRQDQSLQESGANVVDHPYRMGVDNPNTLGRYYDNYLNQNGIVPTEAVMSPDRTYQFPLYKKPVQPVILQQRYKDNINKIDTLDTQLKVPERQQPQINAKATITSSPGILVQPFNGVPNVDVISKHNKETGQLEPVALRNQNGDIIDYKQYKDGKFPKGFQYDKPMKKKYGGKIQKFPGGGRPIDDDPGGNGGGYWDPVYGWVPEENNPHGVPVLDGGLGNDPTTTPNVFDSLIPIFQQLYEGNQGEKNMKQNDIFNPIKGFHGFNYQKGGNINTTGYTPGFSTFNNPYNIIPSNNITMKQTPFPVMGKSLDTGETKMMKPGNNYKFKNTKNVLEIPMYQQGGEIPDQFNNQEEDNFNLKDFLPFILDDARNTLNAGHRKQIPIQTEKGEYISSPLGDIVKVAATKKHKNMEDDHVTDQTSEGNYVFSNDKNMTIKDGKVGKVKLEDISMGYEPIYYKEGELNKSPKEYTMEDYAPNKNKYTFADYAGSLADSFPLTKRENDPFAKRAQVENKLSRIPYLDKLIQLSETKRPTQMTSPTSKFKKGGFASIASIYAPYINANMKQMMNGAATGNFISEDPLMMNINKRDNAMKFQGGGYPYDDRNKGQNKREQWNYWLDQAQGNYNTFAQHADQSNVGQKIFEAAGILGQNPYQGDGEYLNGTQYLSRLDNLQNKQDRSFNSEQAYYQNGSADANTAVRLGADSGIDPSNLVGMRVNAVGQSNQAIAGLGNQRRGMADKYGSALLNATDMYAGRQNQQKAYLNDFNNQQIQNLAGVGSGYLQNKTQIEGANLAAQTQYQLAKQPGNGWTDFTNGLGDFLQVVASTVGAFTGAGGGGGGGNKGNGQNANGTYNYTGPTGPSSTGPYGSNFPWAPGMYGTPYNPGFNTPLNISTNGGYDG